MIRFLWIGVGGALGTWTRYLVSIAAARLLGTSFPFGTLVVNVAGCFLIGFVMQLATTSDVVPPTLRLALTTGFLGGLTTYSSFNYETTRLLQEHATISGLANLGVTLGACFVAGLAGMLAASRFVPS